MSNHSDDSEAVHGGSAMFSVNVRFRFRILITDTVDDISVINL